MDVKLFMMKIKDFIDRLLKRKKSICFILVQLFVLSTLLYIFTSIIPKYRNTRERVFISYLGAYFGVPPVTPVELKFNDNADFARVNPKKEKNVRFKHGIKPYNPYTSINILYNDYKFVNAIISNAIIKNGEKDYIYNRITIAYDYKKDALILCDLGDEVKYYKNINSIRSKWVTPASFQKKNIDEFVKFHLFNIYWDFGIIENKAGLKIGYNEVDNSILIPIIKDNTKYFIIINNFPKEKSKELNKTIKKPQYTLEKDYLSVKLYVGYRTYCTNISYQSDKFIISEFVIRMDESGRISAKENILLETDKYFLGKIDFSSRFTINSIKRWRDFIDRLRICGTPAQQRAWNLLNDKTKQRITGREFEYSIDEDIKESIIEALNELLNERNLYDPESFEKVKLDEEAKNLLKKGLNKLSKDETERFNRLLLQAVFPDNIVESQLNYNPLD